MLTFLQPFSIRVSHSTVDQHFAWWKYHAGGQAQHFASIGIFFWFSGRKNMRA